MARINIDLTFFSDARINRLSNIMGLHRYIIEGKIIRVWSHCYQQISDELTGEEINLISESSQEECFASLMVKCLLAERMEDGRFRIKGVADRIEYLINAQEKARAAGKRSAEAKMAKYGDTRLRNKDGKVVRGQNPPIDQKMDKSSQSESNLGLTPGQSESNPLTLTPPLPPALALAPDSLLAAVASKPPKKPRVKKPVDPTPGSIAFQAYAHHYRIRYGIDPIRSAQTNSQAKGIAGSIPGEHLDGFFDCYLRNPNAYYVQRAHPIGCAQSDCQKIYTEFLTGMRLSSHKARQFELVSENQDVMNRFMAKKYGEAESAKA